MRPARRIHKPLNTLGLLSLTLITQACEPAPKAPPTQNTAPPQPVFSAPKPTNKLPEALIAQGQTLAAKFECARCHDGLSQPTPPQDKHCAHCHQAIMANTYEAAPALLTKWQDHITHLIDLPTLSHAGARFERRWLISFLQEPHDLRHRLEETMPRLKIDQAQATALAAYLMPDEYAAEAPPEGDLMRGESLIQEKGCMSCHSFTGRDALQAKPIPAQLEPKQLAAAMKLATDLRHARTRVRPQALIAWLLDPKAQKPDTTMPKLPLSVQEATDIATFIYKAPLTLPPQAKPPERLPVLSRRVTWAEVEREVFHYVCWHCHSEADYVRGDGGPGNTGGFGFEPRKLSLADYSAISSGLLDHQGQRISVFSRDEATQTPLIIRAMMARHAEVAGQPVEGIRGMPLGLPPMPLEKIQLVESWIAQGRPR